MISNHDLQQKRMSYKQFNKKSSTLYNSLNAIRLDLNCKKHLLSRLIYEKLVLIITCLVLIKASLYQLSKYLFLLNQDIILQKNTYQHDSCCFESICIPSIIDCLWNSNFAQCKPKSIDNAFSYLTEVKFSKKILFSQQYYDIILMYTYEIK